MINYKEGNFFHIDFGHFLENKKQVPVVKISREQDPFVFTPEIAFFVNGKSFSDSKKQNLEERKKKRKETSAKNRSESQDRVADKRLTDEEYKTWFISVSTVGD